MLGVSTLEVGVLGVCELDVLGCRIVLVVLVVVFGRRFESLVVGDAAPIRCVGSNFRSW